MKKIIWLAALVLFVLSQQFGAAGQKVSNVDSSVRADTLVTYRVNVRPLMVKHCTPCHFPPLGNGEYLDTYEKAKEGIDDIISRINQNPGDDGFMPRKHDKLKDSVIHIFERWKKDGLRGQ